ncbi:protein ALP1-like [Nicotiana sylvestris]|uniref:protein ALP1-like n=1 Tax=Nicotiana sylvestris TaxID=4096 RepID=UPI00388CC31A
MDSIETDEDDAIVGAAATSVLADCVGAIDGTHVLASVPIEHQNRYRGRKGNTTQNVLAVVSFNLKFTYVLAGWEGSTHDSRILNDALERPRGFQVPQEKYYLLDAGYGLRKGFIPPYHGDFKTQVDVVLASCILHNHIIDLEPNDPIIQEVDRQPLVQTQNAQITQSSQRSQTYQTPRERREEAREWSLKRDVIAHAMFINYDRRRNR